jgi:hypothetical protein
MRGEEVARHLGDREWTSGLRIVAMTGWNTASLDAAQRNLFDAYLMKPVGMSGLFEAPAAKEG